MGLKLFARRTPETVPPPPEQRRPEPRPVRAPPPYEPAPPTPLENDPLLRCLQLERFGMITGRREQWRDHPGAKAVFDAAA